MNKNQITALVGVGVASFVGGGLIGYKVAQKQAMTALDEFLNEEYRRKQEALKRDHTYSVAEVIEKVNEDLGVRIDPDQIVQELPQPAPEEPSNVVNIFETPNPDWDMEAERNTRSKQPIYILHRDEFFADEMGFRQGQLTYYQGDQVLTDELQHPIHNQTDTVGDNLQFGHGSGDTNVVYIRNELTRMEWEICLDLGRYDVEVLGNDVEDVYAEEDLKHSALRRFPRDD